MDVPLYVICCFPLVAFNTLPLSLIFIHLITLYLGVFLLGFILPETLYASWTWLTISFPILGKFSGIISSMFSQVISLSSSGTPIMQMLVHLMFQRSLRLSFFFHSFFYILFCSSDFHHSALQVTYPFFCIIYSANWFLLVYHSSLFVL